MKGRVTAAALAAGAVLATAATAWAGFATEAGSPYRTGADPLSLTTGDFNADGRPDVAVINGTSSTVSVFLRQAAGGFAQEGAEIPVGSAPGNAAVGDYNGDGLMDLAVPSFSGSVSVLLRQPGGGFALEGGAAIPLGGSPQSAAAGDFDGDGKLNDLVVSLFGANQVLVLVRNGPNTGFTSGFSGPTGTNPSTIAVADFNADGLPDFALVNVGSASVSVRMGAGSGRFVAEPDVPVGSSPLGIAAADFDRDGHPDLAVTNATSNTVSVLLRKAANDGFAEEAGSPIAVSNTPYGITAADFDRDGRADLAVAANSDAVEILRRNAGAGFTRDPAIALPGSPNGIAAADFDGDARPDLAVSQHVANTFSALLNPAPPQPPPPPPTPTVTPTPPLAPPVAGKTVNVAPVSGKVTIKLPHTNRYVALSEAAHIPVGTAVDTRGGRIAITAAQAKGRTASADFFDGLFTLGQTAGAKPVTTLTLTEKLSCPKSAAAAAKKPKTRKLWGDGSGSFRTRGQYSAATVRGTRWLVQDTCTSTLTRVAKGAVSVRDEVKQKTVVLRAGKRYIARAKR